MHTKETEVSREVDVIVSSAESSYGQDIEDVVAIARKNVEPRECPQE